MLKTIWDWIAKSSADPNKLSLTLKAGIPFIVVFFAWQGVDKEALEGALGSAVESIVAVSVLVVQLVTAAIGAYGAIRKIFNTVKK